MKDISKIDKNLGEQKVEIAGDRKYYNIPSDPFDLYGVFYDKDLKRFLRMDSKVANSISDGVDYLNTNTSGGRIRFSTDAQFIELNVKMDYSMLANMPATGCSCFALLKETEKGQVLENIFIFDIYKEIKENTGYYSLTFGLSGKKEDYILYFPLYNNVKELKIGFNVNANVYHGKKYKDLPPVLYYGSSITQGGCASRADNSYTAMIAKENNVDFINLGFSGNCLAENKMAKYLSTINCSVFVFDYDHNAPNAEFLKKTHYSFYKEYRKHNKNTPIIIVSAMNISGLKDRKAVILDTYKKGIEGGDKNLYFIDGEEIIKKELKDIAFVEGCHPNDIGFYFMAQKIGEKINKILKIK